MQLLKDILFPATTEIKRTLSMCDFMLAHLKVNAGILDDPKYDYLFTVEDVNRLVLEGVPFREAYKQVGMAVQRGQYRPTREVRHTHEGSIGNLCTSEIRRKMEPCPRRSDSGSAPMPRRSSTTCGWLPPHGISPTRTRSARPPDTARRSRSTAR